jgi:hypothetical protein
MTKLSRRDQERIEKLLRLHITCLSIGQDLAYVIHMSLNRVGLPFFFLFSDEDCTDHIGGGRDVEEERFLRDW